MDAIKVAKVEGVQCRRSGRTTWGILHLTTHHLIFAHDGDSEEEMWIPYPMISLVTRLPLTLEGQYPLSIHQRNFRSVTLSFQRDSESLDVFESARSLTVTSSATQLYAFFYTPNPPLERSDGWKIYSPRDEFARMGVGSRTKAWRFTDINKDFIFCPTYPARLVVPTRISDTTLQYASKYRSKCRIPTLAYLHWANYGTITRSSQPMVGITNNRSIQDEKLIEAMFQSHFSPESRVSTGPIYGATCTNLIIDARPTTNAMANVAKGAGTENMDYYKDGKKAYLGIDNIHVMRDSLNRVVEVLRAADAVTCGIEDPGSYNDRPMPSLAVLDRQALRRSGWLRHLSAILDGTLLIIRNVHVNSSHVLIHCSDGWDRTAQLSSLAQLCLDPYYRTYKGFQVLVEKDWLSFGHRFLDRCGHLSSEKFFLSAADVPSGGGAEAAQGLFASVQNRLIGQGHLKETSPVFHQFLECVRQIQRQFPDRFEFNGRYLEKIHYHLYSCQFGTFLFNCERDRRVGNNTPPPCERTVSIWDLLNSPLEVEENRNPLYDPTLDDPSRRDPKGNMGVLFPNPRDIRFWHELYGRTDEEMNGKVVAAEAQGVDIIGPVESTEEDPLSPPPNARESGLSQSLGAGLLVSPPSSRSLSPAPISSSSVTLSGNMTLNETTENSPVGHLSSSMPNLVQQRPEPSKQDIFKTLETSSSNLSMRLDSPLRKDTSITTFRDDTPIRRRAVEPEADFIPGVRSVWGRLSSNASAAFTAVQGAYDGVTKELKGMAVTQAQDDTRLPGGELQNRSRSPILRGETDLTTNSDFLSRRARVGPSWATDANIPSERWRSVGPKTGLSTLSLENPWNTQQRGGQHSSPRRADDIFSSSIWASNARDTSSSLPNDPTIPAAPPPPSNQSTSSRVVTEERVKPSQVPSSSSNARDGDPLGVL